VIIIHKDQVNRYYLPNAEHTLLLGYVYVFRFDPNGTGNASQCLGEVAETTTAYTVLEFTETLDPDGSNSEVELEPREYILELYQAPSYSTDTSTFTLIRKERAACVF